MELAGTFVIATMISTALWVAFRMAHRVRKLEEKNEFMTDIIRAQSKELTRRSPVVNVVDTRLPQFDPPIQPVIFDVEVNDNQRRGQLFIELNLN